MTESEVDNPTSCQPLQTSYPHLGDLVTGLFRVESDVARPYKTYRRSASNKSSHVVAVYSSTSVKVASGDVYEVERRDNNWIAVWTGE